MAGPVEEEMSGLPDTNIRRLKPTIDEKNLPSSDDSSVSSLDSDEILTDDDDETPTHSSGVQNKFYRNPAVNKVTTNKFYRPASVNNLSRSHSLKIPTQQTNGSRRMGHSHTNSDTSFIRSVSELNLNHEGNTRKKLSLDVEQLEDAISLASTKTQTSIFRSIGSWFRGSTRSQLSSSSFKLSEDKSSTQQETPTPPLTTYNARKVNSPPVVGTAFATFADTNPPAPPPRRKKKKLRFSEFDNDDDDAAWDVDTSNDDSSTTDDAAAAAEYGVDVGSDADDVNGGGEAAKQFADVEYELRCTNNLQCRHFNRHFRKSPGVKVTNKQLSHQLFADALVVPGNSFGFLDGEPEIRYVEIFGWQIQEELRKTVNEEFDGELLVGQSVILNLDSCENKDEAAEESSKQTEEEETKSNGNEEPKEQKLNGKIETNEKVELNGVSNGEGCSNGSGNNEQATSVGVDEKTTETENNSHNDLPSSLNNNKAEEISSERVVEDMKKHKKIDMDVGDADDIDVVVDNSPTVKHLIYVPIMRVPSLVADTVNCYLGFRAALLAVKKFNAKQSNESSKIKSVICPPLCDGFGEMPPGRIAFQMKSAYDTFALGLSKFADYHSDDLGRLATDHVRMCSMKDGSWC